MKVSSNFYQNSLTESFEGFEIVVPTILFALYTYFENELILMAYHFKINPQVTEI